MLVPPRDANPAVSEATSRAVLAAMALSMSQRLGDAASFEQLLPEAAPLPTAVAPTLPASAPPDTFMEADADATGCAMLVLLAFGLLLLVLILGTF